MQSPDPYSTETPTTPPTTITSTPKQPLPVTGVGGAEGSCCSVGDLTLMGTAAIIVGAVLVRWKHAHRT